MLSLDAASFSQAQQASTELVQQVVDRLIKLVGEYDISTALLVVLALYIPGFIASRAEAWRKSRFLLNLILLAVALLAPGSSVLFLVLLTALVMAALGTVTVPEGHRANIVRMGKYHRTLGPGLHFRVPGFEEIHEPVGLETEQDGKRRPLYVKPGFIITKEELLDPSEHEMICSDNAVVTIDPIVYFKIVEPSKAAFGVENLCNALLKLTETVLRQEIGKLNSDAVISSRDSIGTRLLQALSLAAEPWGTRVVRVEIQDIKFQKDVQRNLEKARTAELAGRADVTTAQRNRDARIAEAEGEKRANELRAEGELALARAQAEGQFLFESRKREGEAAGLRAIAEALRDQPDILVALEAIKRQPEIAQGLAQTKGLVVIPNETAGLVGSLTTLLTTWNKANKQTGDGVS